MIFTLPAGPVSFVLKRPSPAQQHVQKPPVVLTCAAASRPVRVPTASQPRPNRAPLSNPLHRASSAGRLADVDRSRPARASRVELDGVLPAHERVRVDEQRFARREHLVGNDAHRPDERHAVALEHLADEALAAAAARERIRVDLCEKWPRGPNSIV